MKKDMILMTPRELQRMRLLDRVLESQLALQNAAVAMGVCYRQARRLKAAYLAHGAAGLAHGNRGRQPPNRQPAEVRERILSLSREKYEAFNDCHFAEMLALHEGLKVSRDTVRRWRRNAGIGPKRKRRPKKHHARRPRRSLLGEMMIWDGSPHRWFGDERPPCCLMAAIDDATSQVLALRFEEAETSLGYLRLLQAVLKNHGIPACVYQDGHGALFRHDDHWTLAEQLRGKQDPTQVGMVLRDLGIEPIRALSPQAKGRVERLFGTLQDRLIAELALAGKTTLEDANRWLADVFVAHFNRRFAVPAAKTGHLFRRPNQYELTACLSFRYEAVVGNDNTVRLGGLVIDIPPGPNQRGYAKAHTLVRQLLDGSWQVEYQQKVIATHPPTELRAPLKAKTKTEKSKGTTNWTWVYQASASTST